MRRPRSCRLFTLLLVFLSCISASAQHLTLGPQGLVNARARTLRDPTSLSRGVRSYAYLTRVGGVAFDQVASPARALRFSSLTLDYRPERSNGKRLVLTLDGQEVSAPIYDWQLIPIAKFADSPHNACFTLFGELDDLAQQRSVQARGGRVFGYHPAFVNTLMGLRLFQLDSLIIHPYSHDLIKSDGRYVLGAGETRPNLRANESGRAAFVDFFRPIAYSDFPINQKQKFTSYVISDHGRSVSFDVKKGALSLTGQPGYYFWGKNPRGLNDRDKVTPLTDLSNQVSKRPSMLRVINPAVWDAGVKLMRYSAFFRYFKQKHPTQWRAFMAQIDKAPAPSPRVTTPAIMERPR